MTKDDMIAQLDALTQEIIAVSVNEMNLSYRLRMTCRILELLAVSSEQGHTSEAETLRLTSTVAIKLAQYTIEASLFASIKTAVN